MAHEFSPEPTQNELDSIWQELEHPSPDTILESSQVSGRLIVPFPQIAH